eukprot:TRINITY_DN26888_c0_g1_i2.p1 TRINITY_DN26888_c0_g1~~TRINITY_DN26888_c0_g1_i2.p1  ORF type:complete len:224 (+),score=63.97 TRINITY_DN26888_c0_g1_i2:164-835(+)
MGQCTSSAKENEPKSAHKGAVKPVAKQQVKKDMPVPVVDSSTPEERQAAMQAYVGELLRKGQEIFKTDEGKIVEYLNSPADLLTRIRLETRYTAKPLLVNAFELFDHKPHDHVLSPDESNEFISAYCKAMERFIEQMYIDGLKFLEGGKSVDVAEAKRVSSMFYKKGERLRTVWHESCDMNRDGKLQLQEVTAALMGNRAGEAEQLLGEFLSEEFDGILFKEQ